MKIIFALLFSVMMNTAFAFNCTQNEAQFIGNVTELKIAKIGQNDWDCSYKISFTRFNPSMVCPLDYNLATTEEFQDYNCSKKFTNGDEISGVLIEKNGNLSIEE